jgi:hypothetical protein
MCLFGFAPPAIKGETMISKIEFLNSIATLAELLELARTAGFAVTVKKGDIVAIPPGVLMVTVSQPKDVTVTIRWSIMRGGDYKDVRETITTMMQSYSYLEQTDYRTIKVLMEATSQLVS